MAERNNSAGLQTATPDTGGLGGREGGNVSIPAARACCQPPLFIRSKSGAKSEDSFDSDWCYRERRQEVTLLPEWMRIPRT